uniref:Uncharacterized protein n=1 Tax=Octopus bimaculoides TaxID=37653 RepID=A0A0L8HJP3_OCTBM
MLRVVVEGRPLTCYHCKRRRQIKANCPQINNQMPEEENQDEKNDDVKNIEITHTIEEYQEVPSRKRKEPKTHLQKRQIKPEEDIGQHTLLNTQKKTDR